jgi:hypothetical protein
VLGRPLPPGIATLDGYGAGTGHSGDYLRKHWVRQDGFPAPAGILPPLEPGDRGTGPLAYRVAELDAFRARHPGLWGRGRQAILTGAGPGLRMPLGQLAALAGLPEDAVRSWPGAPPLPPAAGDGTFGAQELAAWWNGHAGRVVEVLLTPLGDDERLPLSRFAAIVRKAGKTVYQYQGYPGFPGGSDEGGVTVYRLGDLAAFWQARPGKRAAAPGATAPPGDAAPASPRGRAGPRIRALRGAACLTQPELGERSGCGQSTIAQYEAGSMIPSPAALKRILFAAGAGPEESAVITELAEQDRRDRRGAGRP